MHRRAFLAALGGTVIMAGPVAAEDMVKIGLILPMTGPSASTGREVSAGVRLFMAQHGDTVAGKKVEIIVKDDTGAPDVTKRLAQELVVNDHVAVLAGFGLTPLALAAGPIATQAKTPAVVMSAMTSMIVERSPYFVRTIGTMPQKSYAMADWAAANGIKKVVTLVADYAPGVDSEKTFKERFESKGGQVVEMLRAPVANPEFGAFLQKAKDAKPDALFLFVPSGLGATLMKQVEEREFAKAGIKIIGMGDVPDDEQLNGMGDVALGLTTADFYSAAHDSPENKAYVAAFEKANPSMRPNFMSLGGYDGMALIYKALEKTGGATDGTALIDAMRGMSWVSPRGPVSIDPATRDIVQNIYIRTVERKDGQLWNVELATLPAQKDPLHSAK
jgi:branched-chain amino acid transport system substrate-binding protein